MSQNIAHNLQSRPKIRFWRVPALDGLELLHGSYVAHSFPRHFHDDYVLGVMVRGVEALQHRGVLHHAPVGSVLMINPGEPHANFSVDQAGFAYRTFYPSVRLLSRFVGLICGKESEITVRGPIVEDRIFCSQLLKCHTALERNGSQLEQQTLFADLLAYILARYSTAPPESRVQRSELGYVNRIREYLHAHYSSNVSLAQLGALASISPYHLNRMFRALMGMPPHEYQTHLRILRAKSLLRSGWRPAEAAASVGFVDQSHLTRHFKRIVGLTPSEFSPNRKNIHDTSDPTWIP